MNKTAQKLGENIRRIRIDKKMSQIDLCNKLKFDRAYMSNVENGNKNPTLATIERIAKALNVSLEDLVR
jgi:transcriptional regulator with XRE-family HTH domain